MQKEELGHAISADRLCVAIDVGLAKTSVAVWSAIEWPQAFRSVRTAIFETRFILLEDAASHAAENLAGIILKDVKKECIASLAVSVCGKVAAEKRKIKDSYLVEKYVPESTREAFRSCFLRLGDYLGVPERRLQLMNDAEAWARGLAALNAHMSFMPERQSFVALIFGSGVGVCKVTRSNHADQFQPLEIAEADRHAFPELDEVCCPGHRHIAEHGAWMVHVECGAAFRERRDWLNSPENRIFGDWIKFQNVFSRRIIALCCDLANIYAMHTFIISGGGPAWAMLPDMIEGSLQRRGIASYVVVPSLSPVASAQQAPAPHHALPFPTFLIPLYGLLQAGVLRNSATGSSTLLP